MEFSQPTRQPTYPLHNILRSEKPRWPLVLRFAFGGIHLDILAPVVLHVIFAAVIVYLDKRDNITLGLPGSIVPSLSIVVGLMLVFRNQTSYERFWTGRLNLTAVVTNIRNLTRMLLANSAPTTDLSAYNGTTAQTSTAASVSPEEDTTEDDATLMASSSMTRKPVTMAERADTEKTVRSLLAILYGIKHNLRQEWTASSVDHVPQPSSAATVSAIAREENGKLRSRLTGSASLSRNNTSSSSLGGSGGARGNSASAPAADTRTPLLPPRPQPEPTEHLARPEYLALLPPGMHNFEHAGLGLPLQLTVAIESYIRRAYCRSWVTAPQASGLSALVSNIVDAYGKMEQIKTTPLPVAHLIHQRQVLAAFGCVLPFAMVDDLGWWALLIVGIVMFTLYGIEGIGSQLEDPFGYDRNDIPMDAIIEDTRREILVLLEDWKHGGEIFGKY